MNCKGAEGRQSRSDLTLPLSHLLCFFETSKIYFLSQTKVVGIIFFFFFNLLSLFYTEV